MKKFSFFILFALLSVFTVSAEETTDDGKEKKLKSSFDLDYLIYEDEGAISASLVLGGVVLSGDYVASTKSIEGVK